MDSVYFAVTLTVATNSRALIKKIKKKVRDTRLNTLWELIDALDQASSEINCLPIFILFYFIFLLPVCSFLPPLPYEISYIQSFAAEIGDFWLRPLEWPFTMQNQQQQVWLPAGSCLWAASGLSLSRQWWAQAHTPTTSAWLLLDFFCCCFYFMWGINLSGRTRRLHFASLQKDFSFTWGCNVASIRR